MNRFLIGILVVALLTPLGYSTAHGVQMAKVYENCTELRRDYPTGVAKSRAAATKAERSGARRPSVSKSLYLQNKDSDRDKDLVACEVS
jgi:hypothetical protein